MSKLDDDRSKEQEGRAWAFVMGLALVSFAVGKLVAELTGNIEFGLSAGMAVGGLFLMLAALLLR